jgi:hypothetical protein
MASGTGHMMRRCRAVLVEGRVRRSVERGKEGFKVEDFLATPTFVCNNKA